MKGLVFMRCSPHPIYLSPADDSLKHCHLHRLRREPTDSQTVLSQSSFVPISQVIVKMRTTQAKRDSPGGRWTTSTSLSLTHDQKLLFFSGERSSSDASKRRLLTLFSMWKGFVAFIKIGTPPKLNSGSTILKSGSTTSPVIRISCSLCPRTFRPNLISNLINSTGVTSMLILVFAPAATRPLAGLITTPGHGLGSEIYRSNREDRFLARARRRWTRHTW